MNVYQYCTLSKYVSITLIGSFIEQSNGSNAGGIAKDS